MQGQAMPMSSAMKSTILGGRSLPSKTIGSNKTRIMSVCVLSERSVGPIFSSSFPCFLLDLNLLHNFVKCRAFDQLAVIFTSVEWDFFLVVQCRLQKIIRSFLCRLCLHRLSSAYLLKRPLSSASQRSVLCSHLTGLHTIRCPYGPR